MEIIVVFPFCHKDAMRLLKNLEWQAELGTSWPMCVLSHDASVGPDSVSAIINAASKCFGKVDTVRYPSPSNGDWPPNHAFRETAVRLSTYNRPWLWFEADMVPLVSDWMPRINDAYNRCGKKFFGPRVATLGHWNGTCVYPSDTPSIIPNGIRDRHTAWDVAMRTEMENHAADGGTTIQHAWTMTSERLLPVGGGHEPRFTKRDDLRLLYPSAVLFHRNKDLSLIDRLRECKSELK